MGSLARFLGALGVLRFHKQDAGRDAKRAGHSFERG